MCLHISVRGLSSSIFCVWNRKYYCVIVILWGYPTNIWSDQHSGTCSHVESLYYYFLLYWPVFLSLFVISIVNFISAPPGISRLPLQPHPDFSNLHQLCRSPDTLGQRDLLVWGLCCEWSSLWFRAAALERVNASLVQTRAEEMQRRCLRSQRSYISIAVWPCKGNGLFLVAAQSRRGGLSSAPGFLSLLHWRPACSLGLRWSSSRLWKQTVCVCFLRMEPWLCVAEHTAALDQPAQQSQLLIMVEVVPVKWLHFNVAGRDLEGILVRIAAFELRLNIRARLEPYGTGTVWKEAQSKAQRTAALCGSHAGYTAHTNSMAAAGIGWGGIRLLSREGKHQIPCSYRQCLKCKWAVSAGSSVVDPLLRWRKPSIFLRDGWATSVLAESTLRALTTRICWGGFATKCPSLPPRTNHFSFSHTKRRAGLWGTVVTVGSGVSTRTTKPRKRNKHFFLHILCFISPLIFSYSVIHSFIFINITGD